VRRRLAKEEQHYPDHVLALPTYREQFDWRMTVCKLSS
jgi:hypothetical protein